MRSTELRYVILDTIHTHRFETNDVIQLHVARRLARLGVLADLVDWLPGEDRTLIVEAGGETFLFDVLGEGK
jgi:hypothetical protein